MKGADHVLMDEFTGEKPRTTKKSYKPYSYLSPVLVCFVVTSISLLVAGMLGFFTTEATSNAFLQTPQICDACDLNTDIEDYVVCRTCPFKKTEEKILKCPNGKTDVKILSTWVGGKQDAGAEAVIYDHCQETRTDDPDWDCTINFAALMGEQVDPEIPEYPTDVVELDPIDTLNPIDIDVYDPYTEAPEPEVDPQPAPREHKPRPHRPRQWSEMVMEIEIDPGHTHEFDPVHEEFLDPAEIMRQILAPQDLPMGPVLEATQHMYAAQLFGMCTDNKRPGCYLDPDTKSKPTKCKNKEGDVVDLERGSWPPCPDTHHPACDDGSSVVCSDGQEPQRPQLCTQQEDVPTCQDDSGNTAEVECEKPGKEPIDFFCGRFHPAKCPDGFTAMCSDGPATLPRKGGGKGNGKGKGKGNGKGKGKGRHRRNKGNGISKNKGSSQEDVANEPFLARFGGVHPPPRKGSMGFDKGPMGFDKGPMGFGPWGNFPHHRHHHWHEGWAGHNGLDEMIKVKYMCVSTQN